VEKIILEFTKKKNESFDFLDKKIQVVGFIGIASQIILANIYLDAYFNPELKNIEDMFLSGWDYLGAENALMLAILDKLTNVTVFDENRSAMNVDYVVESGLWYHVKTSIENYDEFRASLEVLVENAKQEELMQRSLGGVIDELTIKLVDFVNSLVDMDISDSGLEKIAGQIAELSKSLENTPLRPLLEEAKHETETR